MEHRARQKINLEAIPEDPFKGMDIKTLFLKLSPPERQVLRFVAAGRTAKEIAEKLGITLSTVQDHIQKMLDKLDLDSQRKLAVFYERLTKLNPLPDNDDRANELP